MPETGLAENGAGFREKGGMIGTDPTELARKRFGSTRRVGEPLESGRGRRSPDGGKGASAPVSCREWVRGLMFRRGGTGCRTRECDFNSCRMETYDSIKKAAEAVSGQVLLARRTLHANPELSFEERETSRYVADCLREAGIEFRPIAGTGVLARIEGRGDLRRCVVLRADMDALPIEEKTGLEYASRNKGVMHACGHDVHTACLLGAMLVLKRMSERIEGTVFGLFQPGEELCPGGASLVLAEDPFRDYEVAAFVGEHVAAEIPAGRFGFRAGQYMASSDELRITVRGTGGHGALPHTLTDPVVAAAAIVTSLQQIVSRNADGTIPTVLSIGRLIADGATNIIPPTVEMEGTLRTMDETWRGRAKRRVAEIAAGTAAAYGVEAEVKISDGYPCVVNDPALTARARQVVGRLWGADRVEELALRMTAEDFGSYTKRYPSVFFRLGVARTDGPTGGLHTSVFDPDERALDYGVATMAALALELGR